MKELSIALLAGNGIVFLRAFDMLAERLAGISAEPDVVMLAMQTALIGMLFAGIGAFYHASESKRTVNIAKGVIGLSAGLLTATPLKIAFDPGQVFAAFG